MEALKLVVDTQICSGCNTELPRAYFHKNKERKNSLSSLCRECYAKAYVINKKISYDSYLTCRVCQKEKHLYLFKKPKGQKRGYDSICKNCYYEANKGASVSVYTPLSDEAPMTCSECKQEKTAKDFHKNVSNVTGRAGQCRKCINKIRSKNVEYKRKKMINSKMAVYKLTEKEYYALLEKHSVCAICGKKPSKPLCIDHNHATHKVRGLLCKNCNFGIGYLKEDVSIFQKAIEYLIKHSDK